ncbi:hypothetical protein U6A24_07850 [Aquimarina gracilis]|uniref:Regulatory LuxR family protein n=1 Tax=Aquimarina gracilis TaxID=874422 RepID=A0ABU5ZU90_9FLAO|nr:hypothetical protein [Aquimarina gracilis]MEB3345366.1 hypothetical protein [Aquimarina gracilis]
MMHTLSKLLNDKELTYLSLTFQGLDKEAIAKELQFNDNKSKRHSYMKNRIFDKLSVNNWHNAFRRAFNLQLLDRQDFLVIDIQKEASTISTKITEILNSTEIDDKEKELVIYLALLSFQIKIEYSYLFKEKE